MRRRVFLIVVVAITAVLIWRPDWRAEVFRVLGPVAAAGREAARPWVNRALAELPRTFARMRGQQTPAPPEPGAPAVPVAPPEPSVDPAAPPTPVPSGNGKEMGPPAPPERQADADEPIGPAGNLPPKLPALAADRAVPAAVRALQATARSRPSAWNYRRLADAAAGAGLSEVAATAYLKEAEFHRKDGDPNAAQVETLKAGRYRAEGRLYLHAPGLPPTASAPARAPLEPAYGAMLGAFIDRDDQLPTVFMDENWQHHREPAEFAERVGRGHASLFCYLSYGRPWPREWFQRLWNANVVPHVAWEPDRLSDVTEASLIRYADELGAMNRPVFIRFASEMNGDWTPYHQNPAEYRETFRRVHRVFRARAPKAAVIWCVNNIPETPIPSYYPGDDAVDWVGVNFYNVPFADNDPKKPADHLHPADLLKYVYDRYSAKKPIAICEYAASSQAAVDGKPRPELAARKMRELYSALPRLYPRVKLIDWFDCNNLRHAPRDRQLNNYSLTENPEVEAAYEYSIRPDYFLSRHDAVPGSHIRPLRDGEAVAGIVTLSAWVRAPIPNPRSYLLVDDQVLYAGDLPGAPVARWDARQAKPGRHTVRLLVLDREGRKLWEQKSSVLVAAVGK